VDNAALRARTDELLLELENLRKGLGGLQQTLMQISATVTSDDGMVKATVGPRGQLISLELDPRLYRRPDSKQLAVTITKTVQAAAAKAQEQVTAALKPFVPEAEIASHLNMDFAGPMRRMDHELSELERS
jgi:DNA-binding protein YbaB